jgi:hypothetical protein
MSDRAIHMIKLGGPDRGFMYITNERIITSYYGNFGYWVFGIITFLILYLVISGISWVLFLLFDLIIWYMNLILMVVLLFSIIFGWLLCDKFNEKNAKRNMDLPPNDILKNNKKNFQILNSDISRIKIFNVNNASPRIQISSPKKDRSFIIHAKDVKNLNSYIMNFKEIFGNRLISEF